MDDVEIIATSNSTELARDNFSVIFVTLSLRGNPTSSDPSPTVSPDNDRRNVYIFNNGNTDRLGLLSASSNPVIGTGVEIVGLVLPSDFTSAIEYRRTVTLRQYGNLILISQKDNAGDTNLGTQDINPQSNNSMGKIYDLARIIHGVA